MAKNPNSESIESTAVAETIELPRPPALNSPPESLSYNCVCGEIFEVDCEQGGVCPSCSRSVRGEVLQQDIAMTICSASTAKSSKPVVSAEAEKQVGQILGHFRLESVLGVGGMGAVYRAFDNSLKRFVAVKVVHRSSDGNSTKIGTDSILQEAVAQARLNHPYVTTIYYVGCGDEAPFMAMELLPGGTLADRTQDERLPFNDVIRYVMQTASALRHAAQFDIVHADVKPSNLLLSGDGRIKLSDFGLSRCVVKNSDNQSFSGTPAYLAPEIIDGGAVTIQSDMYALGVTLFELLFGRYPIELTGSTLVEKLNSHRERPIEYPTPWPKNVPVDVRDFIERLLAKSPAQRFENYEELMSSLSRLQPMPSVDAGIAPRVAAFVMDQLLWLISYLPFLVLAQLLTVILNDGPSSWVGKLVVVLWIALPVGIAFIVYAGWNSPGQSLFQLRTIDSHGLPLTRTERVTREVLRSSPTLLLILAMIGFQLTSNKTEVWDFFPTFLLALGLVTLLVNTVWFILTGLSRPLHDKVLDSRLALAAAKRTSY